jgi:hypothetical protein
MPSIRKLEVKLGLADRGNYLSPLVMSNSINSFFPRRFVTGIIQNCRCGACLRLGILIQTAMPVKWCRKCEKVIQDYVEVNK